MIFVVDGNNLANRANYMVDLYGPDGNRTSGIYGFFLVLSAALRRYEEGMKISGIVVCWDQGGSEWRKKLYPEYKANRDEGKSEEELQIKRDLGRQMSIIRKILRNLGVVQYSSEGVEADDLMAKLAFEAKEPMVILSGDKDIIQLVSRFVSVIVPHRDNFLVTKENFKEYTGFRNTARYIAGLSLQGDKTDNITKPPGIGEVTAKNLVDLYGLTGKIIKASRRFAATSGPLSKIKGFENMIKRNLVLMKLDYFYEDVGKYLDEEIMVDKGGYDTQWVEEIFEEMDFESFTERFDDFRFLFDRVRFRSVSKKVKD